MAIYNRLRFRKYTKEERLEIASFNSFFHPLDSIGHWNRLYGERGFFQYQCLLPESPHVAKQIRALLTAIQRQGSFPISPSSSTTGAAKACSLFRKRATALHSISLTINVYAPFCRRSTAGSPSRAGGLPCQRDIMLAPGLFYHMYGQAANDWCNLINDINPGQRFTSLMSKRLGWKVAP